MADGIKIDIVSPERLVLSDRARSVTVPGTEGYFTAMAGHAPFMTTLRQGFITVTPDEGAATIFLVRGGFCDISPEGMTILAEEASDFSGFNQAEFDEQMRQAQQKLDAAESHEDRAFAQQFVSGLANLAIEAGHLNGVHAN